MGNSSICDEFESSEEEYVNKCHSLELKLEKWRPQNRRELRGSEEGAGSSERKQVMVITRRQRLPRGAAVCTLSALVIEDDYS